VGLELHSAIHTTSAGEDVTASVNTYILYSKITAIFLNDGSTGINPLQNLCGQTGLSDFTLFFQKERENF
jgi:hypothetical protein